MTQYKGKKRENSHQKLKRSLEQSTSKHTENYLRYFNGHRHLSQSEESECMWIHYNVCDTIFVMCSHTFTLFWLRKKSVTIKMFRISFRVFVCAFPQRSLQFFVRFFPFLSLILCYSYIDTFLSMWSVLLQNVHSCFNYSANVTDQSYEMKICWDID
jgi:hypothetical protein